MFNSSITPSPSVRPHRAPDREGLVNCLRTMAVVAGQFPPCFTWERTGIVLQFAILSLAGPYMPPGVEGQAAYTRRSPTPRLLAVVQLERWTRASEAQSMHLWASQQTPSDLPKARRGGHERSVPLSALL